MTKRKRCFKLGFNRIPRAWRKWKAAQTLIRWSQTSASRRSKAKHIWSPIKGRSLLNWLFKEWSAFAFSRRVRVNMYVWLEEERFSAWDWFERVNMRCQIFTQHDYVCYCAKEVCVYLWPSRNWASQIGSSSWAKVSWVSTLSFSFSFCFTSRTFKVLRCCYRYSDCRNELS